MTDLFPILSIVSSLGFLLAGGNILFLSVMYLLYRQSVIFKITGVMMLLVDYVSLVLVFLALLYNDGSELLIPASIVLYGIGMVFSYLIIFYLSKKFVTPLNKAVKTSNEIGHGDLTGEFMDNDSRRKDEIGILENSHKNMLKFLKPVITSTNNFTEHLIKVSQDLASSSEEVSASSEELSSIAHEISNVSHQQSESVKKSIEELKEFNLKFNNKLKGIESTSAIINSIHENIAILSLNASIEAARSGEYGRGFAVVADNIRKLSDETKSSMTAIDSNIKDVIVTINNMMESLFNNFQSIDNNANQYSIQSDEVESATNQQTSILEEISLTAQSLATLSMELGQVSNKFKVTK